MANNKLNLLVQFTGVDKLSSNIKNIVGAAGKGSAAIDDMRGEVRLMEKDLARVQRTLSKGGSQNGGLIMAERELREAIERTNHQIDRQERKLKNIENVKGKLRGAGQSISKAGAIGFASITAPAGIVLATMDNLANKSREMQNTATLAGMGFEEFQRGAHAAASRGIGFDKFGDILKDTQDKIGDFTATGGGEMKDFFEKIAPKSGVTAKSFRNLSGSDALQLYYNSLVKAGVSQKEMVFYMEAIADEGSGLIPLLKNNGEAMKELGANASVISEEDSADLERYLEAQSHLQTSITQLNIALAKSGLIDGMTALSNKAAGVANWFSALSPEVKEWAIMLGVGAAVAGPILIVLGLLVSSLATLAPVFVAVGSGIAFMAGGIGTAVMAVGSALAGIVGAIGIVPILIAAGLAAIAYAVYSNWDAIYGAVTGGIEKVKTFFSALPGWMKTMGGMIMMGLLSSLSPAMLVARMISIAQAGVTAFKNYFGIKSPSRLFIEMGGHINDGLGIGLDKGKERPVRAATAMAGAVASAGALALAPAASATALAPVATPSAAAAPARQMGGDENHFHIYQQPGEDTDALLRRLMDMIKEEKARKERSQFGDDF